MENFRDYLRWTANGQATCLKCGATATSFAVLIHDEACEVGIEEDKEEARQRIEWEKAVEARQSRAARREQFYQELKAQEAQNQ